MRFRAEHRFAGSVAAVAELLVDPAFHEDLELPDLSLLGVVDEVDDGTQAELALRYEYVGHIDPVVQRLLAGRRPKWVQGLVLDRPTGTGRLTFAAEGQGDRLQAGAEFTLRAEGEETVWDLQGEVKVRVPLISRAAERRLVDGVLRRLATQAAQLAERLP